jgi:hypothetical protein
MKSLDFIKKPLVEEATAGASMSSTVATTVPTLGEKGSFSKKEVQKRLQGYTNALTPGGPVKIKAKSNG